MVTQQLDRRAERTEAVRLDELVDVADVFRHDGQRDAARAVARLACQEVK